MFPSPSRLQIPQLENPELRVYTKYSRVSGGARVRVFDWLKETGIPADVRVFATYDPENRSSRYVTDGLEYATKQSRLLRDIREVKSARCRTLVYRQATPFGRGGIEAKLLRSASFGVFDFDDAIHLQSSAGRLGTLFPPPVRAAVSVAAADQVIAGNEFLADWASGYSTEVSIIPSCVSPENYRLKVSYELSEPPRVGWIGSHSTDRYLDKIRSPLLELHKRTGARVVLIGSRTEHRGELEKMIDRIQWTEQDQHELLCSMDVGIMPLPDTEFARGKCAYKLLQYGAAGVPSIGSPVGANTAVLRGMGGWAPTTDAEWLDALLEAVTASSQRRRVIGELARTFVAENYSYRAWRRRWELLVLGRESPATTGIGAVTP